ncbi:TetR/AcrR family transcriptional regulator [Nocardia sp. NPDC059239]|uniref:TetR/AcrR family transcriptional regulator n=1 Tax=unclassified Nocardia TaxID=2637762 RepID=UPI0036D07D07
MPTKTVPPEAHARKPRADAARNRRRILDAADRLLARHGGGVTLDDVADEAGVGVGTAYRHFGNKHDLIAEVLSGYLDQIREIIRQSDRDPDPWRGLVRMLERTCELIAGNRAFVGAMTGSGKDSTVFDQYEASINFALDNLLVRARSIGALRTEITSADIWGTISMVNSIAGFTHQVAPNNWRRHLALILNGIRSDSTPALPIPKPSLTTEQIRQARAAPAQERRR